MLEHKLATLGFNAKRYLAVPEPWTSIMCHKCGHKGLRPKQNLFICHTCGYRANTDLNGAINIGKRLIMLIPSLRDEKGLGMWLTPKDRAILKARRKTRSSKGKSSLPQKLPASIEGESVADCYDQASLEEVASGKDPAMANTVETPSASGNFGGAGVMQRTEARSHRRNDIPVKRGKAHVILKSDSFLKAGDSSREKGGTQKFLWDSLTRDYKK